MHPDTSMSFFEEVGEGGGDATGKGELEAEQRAKGELSGEQRPSILTAFCALQVIGLGLGLGSGQGQGQG